MIEFKDVRFACPQCDKHLIIDAQGVGFIVTCPDCKTRMIVPEQSGDSASLCAHPLRPQEPRAGVEPLEEPEFQGSAVRMVSEREATSVINNAFAELPQADDLSPAARFVLQTIRTLHKENTKLGKLVAAEKRFGKGYRRQQRQEMVDLLLHFLSSCLEDGKITAREIEAQRMLRRLLNIRDGDLYNERKDAVRRLIERQIDWMESDFQISHSEELYLVDLQRIFDLSYDQLLELAQPHVAEVLDNLCLLLPRMDTPDLRLQIDQLMRVFCMHDYRPFELKKEDADEVAGRMIPQSVKDTVWRRDRGRCVFCGGQGNLEFDHIIPFSLGGSNTYRNIQLLCQDCNRSKSAKIG